MHRLSLLEGCSIVQDSPRDMPDAGQCLGFGPQLGGIAPPRFFVEIDEGDRTACRVLQHIACGQANDLHREAYRRWNLINHGGPDRF